MTDRPQTAWLNGVRPKVLADITWIDGTLSLLTITDKSVKVCEGGTAAAVGDPILASGVHEWTCHIRSSFKGWGDAMLIGVTDASVDWPTTEARSWGLLPIVGSLYTTPNRTQLGTKQKELCPPLDGTAEGAVVRIIVDMDNRLLSYSVNGGDIVDSGTQLPKMVRPWVTMCFEGDHISFETEEEEARREAEEAAVAAAKPPTPPPLLDIPDDIMDDLGTVGAERTSPRASD